ncbi:MAG TPA: GNAT family N-acetyltransferase [Oscillospiraceae bacterium]|nr:GNAT family N-acetyltransferase [Oscillospiraceae bacterium]HPF55742.1 GNAT family N-acetyltransferase [Clostridiales bacterium]HPK34261.1 GNAT family N-acetyltransferase [Oscillospiraceae bacterium]HPR74836.1 GNAT family N-acetyltransferase [Oscillospiraceae bacterium]
MNRLKLIFPTLEMEQQALAFRRECFENGETEIQGDGGFDYAENYADWIAKINADLTSEENPYVPATLYFAFDGDKLVGVTQIRHRLNAELLKCNGNIGYHIRPSERRKGYATEMLSLVLKKCRELGLEKVLVSCDNDNFGSAKTILKNGGVLENEVLVDDGAIVQRYWITL